MRTGGGRSKCPTPPAQRRYKNTRWEGRGSVTSREDSTAAHALSVDLEDTSTAGGVEASVIAKPQEGRVESFDADRHAELYMYYYQVLCVAQVLRASTHSKERVLLASADMYLGATT